jgi:PAS domain S-box-containing protein
VAIQRLETTRYDAVVCGHDMPEVDGIELLSLLRIRGNEVPFILFSPRGREDVVIKALNNGADFYLEKSGSSSTSFADLQHMIRTSVASKRAEAGLRESEAKYRGFVRNLKGIAFQATPDSMPVFCHGLVEEITGYKEEELLAGKPTFDKLVHPDDLPRVLAEEEALRKSPNVAATLEYRIIRKDGGVRFVETHMQSFAEVGGWPIKIQGMMYDITERKRNDEALRQANEKLRILGNVTRHDALNQLAVLTGWLSISRQTCNDKTVLDYMERMKAAAETMRLQLEFTADYQDMGMQKPGWIDINKAFDRGVAGLALGEVTVERGVDGLEIFADPMLDKVFHNLVDNSIRHGGRITRIGLRALEEGDDLLIIFEDDGSGIVEKEKEIVFEPGHGKHTGFGLYLTRAILGLTGITIVENGVEDRGARFEMRVPAGKFRYRQQK